jgi:aryl carrier-like protein
MLTLTKVAGLGFTLIVSMFQGCIPVYPLASAPPTTQGLMEAITNTKVDFAFVAHVMVDEIGKDAAMLNMVASRLKYIYYTGGSVPKGSGDAVASRIGLYQVLGSSETATFPLIRPQDDETCQNWNWVHINPKVHPEFRHRYDDLFELVLVRDSGSEANQPVFTHFPDLQEYETRDLYSPHPSKPNLWTHRSRTDDIIVFLNGEKTNPVTFEQQVSRHSEVRSALVVGQQRFEAALLIELANLYNLTPEERLDTIDRIWLVVKEANLSCPHHATVSKSRMLLVDPAMPMSRAGKGTVQRQATSDKYSEQLDALYADIEAGSSRPLPNDLDIFQQASVSPVVRDIVTDVTQWKTLDDEDDFFGRGMDSLQVLRLARELKSKLKLASMGVKDVYANPSISLLS